MNQKPPAPERTPSMTQGRLPLVLLPGMNCTADIWSDCGLNGSIMPTLDEPTLEAQVDALLDTLPGRFSLAGLSLGGIVAMSLCRRAPERVERLCLISTNAKSPTQKQRDGWRLWRDRLASGASPMDLQQDILEALFSRPAQARNPGLGERILRMGDETGVERLDAQLRMQDTRVDESVSLSQLKMPVFVISGALDVICPPQFHEDIVAVIPQARMAVLDTGHLVPMERPQEVGRLINDWING